MDMFDKVMYTILGKLDKLFEVIIPSIYERLKNNRIFSSKKEKENKQKDLFRNLKKEVETGANGTQKYVIKKGMNKGKIADVK